ncbi:hypothetical protein H5410_041534 [Solanum commersonii]|uniref:Uncharacterized protein n=1 Tax=Solanum commersonii TaxID=4109 RepID=A0A9J5XUU7_SOLCO|nr:hypothetical protein H5410_041534 [Solanum commersonii]
MSKFSMIVEINRNLHLLAAYIYPWLDNIPMFWPLIVKAFDNYSPLISSKIVSWKLPEEDHRWDLGNSLGYCSGYKKNPRAGERAYSGGVAHVQRREYVLTTNNFILFRKYHRGPRRLSKWTDNRFRTSDLQGVKIDFKVIDT